MNQKPFSYWLEKNRYYHQQIINFYHFIIPQHKRVLQINGKNGYVLDAIKPSHGVVVDSDAAALAQGQQQYPQLTFYAALSEIPAQQFDYIILTLQTMETYDIQDLFLALHPFCHAGTRIVVDSYSHLWEPVLQVTQKIGLRRPTQFKNWISHSDLLNFLPLSHFEKITVGRQVLMPMYIPLISAFCNKVLVHVPLIKRLSLHEWVVARPINITRDANEYTVSVVIPCRNERGNIQAAIERTPIMGKHTEFIFVEGHSKDGTYEETLRVKALFPDKDITCLVQDGKGKGDAVRKGFAHAKGDILMILDADLTAPPEEMPKFFNALVQGKGEFINGSRLVYGMENEAMRFLNLIANYSFGCLFSWLLGQPIKDTLCGTKVLFKKDYEEIVANRAYFGDFDPFGDFDLIFGAAKLNRKIVDMPVHYKNRAYGTTQISRFSAGFMLLAMSFVALRKFKIR